MDGGDKSDGTAEGEDLTRTTEPINGYSDRKERCPRAEASMFSTFPIIEKYGKLCDKGFSV